jgi:primosomal protein N' (replication factor Y)
VLLGSATPSLESWQRAERAATAPDPAHRMGGGALPRVRLVDMNHLPKVRGVTTALSPRLLAALRRAWSAASRAWCS